MELAVLTPALLLLVFAVVQVALWSYAHNLAMAAAQEGASVGSSYGSTPEAGAQRARAVAARSADDTLTAVTVSSAGSSATAVRVEVTGRSISAIPGVAGFPISAVAVAPVERVAPWGVAP